MPWLAQAAERLWRRLRVPAAARRAGRGAPSSFPAAAPAAAGPTPKQRRGHADKMLRPGADYQDKGG